MTLDTALHALGWACIGYAFVAGLYILAQAAQQWPRIWSTACGKHLPFAGRSVQNDDLLPVVVPVLCPGLSPVALQMSLHEGDRLVARHSVASIVRHVRVRDEDVAVEPAPVSGEPDLVIDGIDGLHQRAPSKGNRLRASRIRRALGSAVNGGPILIPDHHPPTRQS